MASEVEIERLIVRLLGDNSGYQKMAEEAQAITTRLEETMRRLGGTQAELNAVTARTAGFVQQASQATGLYYFEERRLQGLMNTGRIGQESYNRQLDKARSGLESVATAVNAEIQSMSRGVELTRRSENAQERHNREMREYNDLLAKTHIGQETFNRLKQASLTSLFSAPPPSTFGAFGSQMQQASLNRGRELTNSVRTAQERYNNTMAEYSELSRHGSINAETFNRLHQQQQQILTAANAPVSRLGHQMRAAGNEARNFGLIWSVGVTVPLTAFMKKAGGAAVTMDSLKRGLNALSKSPKEVEEQLVRLREVAKLPGLGFKESIEGSVRLQAAGMSAKMAERSLLAFGNALATVGKGKTDLDGVNLALSQMMSKSIISGQELNQLGERLPQIRQVMLRAFGTISGEEIGKLGLSSIQVIERIIEELEKLPKVTGGALNSLENLSDSVFISMSKIGNSVLRVALPMLESLGKTLEGAADWFDKLSPSIQNTMVIMVAMAAGIGPVIVVIGQLVSSVGTLIVAYNALAASQTALAAATLLGWQLVIGGVIAGAIVLLVASMTGYLDATTELNNTIQKSMALHQQWLAGLARQRQEILAVSEALDSLERKAFLSQQITKATIKVNEYAASLRKAKAQLEIMKHEEMGKLSRNPFRFGIPAEIKEQKAKIEELTKTYEDATGWVKELNKEVEQIDAPPTTLQTLKEMASLKKETEDYIKSLKRKIELEERGEAGSKIQSLKDRGVDPEKIREIEDLVEKEGKLSEAKKMRIKAENLLEQAETKTSKAAETAAKKKERESKDLEHDIQQLSERLQHQIATYNAVGESAQVFALQQRVAAGNATEHAKALLEEAKAHDINLQKMKERTKLEEEALQISKKYNPSEAFKEEFKRLTEMSKEGLIAKQTFDLAVMEIEDRLLDAQDKANIRVRFTVEGNEAVRRGSAEFQKLLSEVDKANRRIADTRQMAEVKAGVEAGLGIAAIPPGIAIAAMKDKVPDVLALDNKGGLGFGAAQAELSVVDRDKQMMIDEDKVAAAYSQNLTSNEDYSKEMLDILANILDVNEQQLEEPAVEFTELGIGG